MTIDPADLRSRLEALLTASKIDATELSRRIGRSPEYVRDFLRGRKNSIKANELLLIEKELGAELGSLTGFGFDTPAEAQRPVLRGYRGAPPPKFPQMHHAKQDKFEDNNLGDTLPIGTPIYVAKENIGGDFTFDNYPYDFVQRPWFFKEARLSYGVIVAGYSLEPFFHVNDVALVSPEIPLVRGRMTFLSQPLGATLVRFRIVILEKWSDREWTARHPGDGNVSSFPREEWPSASRVVGKVKQ